MGLAQATYSCAQAPVWLTVEKRGQATYSCASAPVWRTEFFPGLVLLVEQVAGQGPTIS